MTHPGPTHTAPGSGDLARSAEDLMREQRLQRNLKIVVGFLGFLILAGLSAVVVRILVMADRPPSAAHAAKTTAVAMPGGEVALEIPRGAKIVSVSVSGNRLAVHHESPTGAGITVIDVDTGRRVLDIKPTEAAPTN